MALEREFVAASERCEYERAVFRLKKTKYMLVTFGGGGVTFQGYVKKKKTSQRREQQSSVKIKIKLPVSDANMSWQSSLRKQGANLLMVKMSSISPVGFNE